MIARVAAIVLAGFLIAPAQAADQVEKAPPAGAYKKVGELVKLPTSCRGSASST